MLSSGYVLVVVLGSIVAKTMSVRVMVTGGKEWCLKVDMRREGKEKGHGNFHLVWFIENKRE